MSAWSRRRFAKLAGAAGLTAAARVARPVRAGAAVQGRVVVIGGGVGGATAAKLIARDSPGLDVTLVEPAPRYVTPFFSNLYLGGLRPIKTLSHGYGALREKYGVRLIHARAVDIDPAARKVRLSDGARLAYDRLVVAPGIGFRAEAIEGYDAAATQAMPHAWAGGAQLELLKRQLDAMADGGLVLMAVPQRPYRCPPAPYERAALIAGYLKRHKPRSKILIIDSKDSFPLQDLFEDGWYRFAEGLIEWLPGEFNGGGVKAVDVRARRVMTEDEAFGGDVINLIPPQRAGDIALAAGLADETGWCPVDPRAMASRLQPDIHVVGDAIDPGQMPKSGFGAHHQARLCAAAVRAALTGAPVTPAPLLNACWSFLAADHVIRVSGTYEATAETLTLKSGFISARDEDDRTRAAAAREATRWYADFTHDIFG